MLPMHLPDPLRATLAEVCRGLDGMDRPLDIARCADTVAAVADRIAAIVARMEALEESDPEWERLRAQTAEANAEVDALVEAGPVGALTLKLIDYLDQQGGHLRMRLGREIHLLERLRPEGWQDRAQALSLVRLRVHSVWCGAHARVLSRLMRHTALVWAGVAAKGTSETDVERMLARQEGAGGVAPFTTVEAIAA
jgi:hypothetical protein